VNKKDSTIFNFIEDTSNTLKNHKYEYIFNAFTDAPSDNICLTNNEKTIFIEAFKKGRINK
jgi:hypothetical protein